MSRANRKAKRKLSGASPPKRKVKGGKNSEADCLVCDEPILEPGEHCEGDEAVFCEGNCQGWIHRQCAGLTRPAFDSLGESTPYLCSHCTLNKQSHEICALKDTIKTLTDKLNKLEGSQKKQATQSQATHQQPMLPTNLTSGPLKQPKTFYSNQQRSSDRKCNVIFYGFTESPPNTSKATRSQSDLKNVHSAVPNIQSSVIKDLHRLGKFKPGQQRPRLLLVECLRVLDAKAVLFESSKLSPPILAKPDMTPEERNIESLLLKERWNLIKQGYPRKTIRIRNAHIYVNNQPYGVVANSKFTQLSQLAPLQATPNVSSSPLESATPNVTSSPPESTSTANSKPSESVVLFVCNAV